MKTEENKMRCNGVDVGRCENYRKNGTCIDADYHLFDYNTKQISCENIKNCYYKRLARKEQECEKLKQKLDVAKETFKRIEKEIDNLFVIEPLNTDLEMLLDEIRQVLKRMDDENDRRK